MFDPHYISENERWVAGWRGYYSVTKDGVPKSYVNDTVIELSINFSKDRNGGIYGTVTFGVGTRLEYYHVARLVYETFVRPLAKDERIVCKNGNRRDLRLENLEVKTISEVNNNPNRIAKDKDAKCFFVLIQYEDSDVVIPIKGFVNAKKTCGISGNTLRRKIREAEREGKSFIIHKKQRIEFLVERSARYDNCDPNNARKKAA
ncbi:MAG: hypothetical protein IKZ07_06310 [Akkermansia sp.]|nr:hypothetical protein [Akkermansia sp.]